MGVMNNLKRIKALEAGGGSGGGSVVGVQQILNEGTHIADITVDGTKTELYAPSGSSSNESNIVTNGITDVMINSVDKTSEFVQKPFLIGDGHIMCFSGVGLLTSAGVAVTDSFLQFTIHTDASLKAKMNHILMGRIKYSENGEEKSMITAFLHSGNEITLKESIMLSNQITIKEIVFDSSPWFLT